MQFGSCFVIGLAKVLQALLSLFFNVFVCIHIPYYKNFEVCKAVQVFKRFAFDREGCIKCDIDTIYFCFWRIDYLSNTTRSLQYFNGLISNLRQTACKDSQITAVVNVRQIFRRIGRNSSLYAHRDHSLYILMT